MSAEQPSSVTDFIWALPNGTQLSDYVLPFISLEEPPTELLRGRRPGHRAGRRRHDRGTRYCILCGLRE